MSASSIDRVLKSLTIKVKDPLASTDLQMGLNAVDYSKHVPKSHKSDLMDGFIDGAFSELEDKKIKK